MESYIKSAPGFEGEIIKRMFQTISETVTAVSLHLSLNVLLK